MKTRHIFRGLLMALAGLALAALPARAEEISIFAAASMKDTMNELSDAFAAQNPGVTFQKNYGASGALAKQIENGAPADIFISASTEWMDYLKEKNLIDVAGIAVLAYNELVFVGKPEVKASGMADLADLERIAIGSPMSVPAGQYAMEALKKTGLDKKLENRLVMARDVRECLMYAERAEVAGAFVYMTDARQLCKNTRVLFTVAQELYSRVTYPMAPTVTGSRKAQAAAFLQYLQSPEAQKKLAGYGFIGK